MSGYTHTPYEEMLGTALERTPPGRGDDLAELRRELERYEPRRDDVIEGRVVRSRGPGRDEVRDWAGAGVVGTAALSVIALTVVATVAVAGFIQEHLLVAVAFLLGVAWLAERWLDE